MKKSIDIKKEQSPGSEKKFENLLDRSECKSLEQAWKSYKPEVPYSFIVAAREAVREKNL